MRADRKSVIVRDEGQQENYFDKGLNEIHSSDSNLSVSVCGDGVTRRSLTFVTGCTLEKSDLEVRSSCSSDINFPKCKYIL